jgi:erythromycin esterase
MCYNGTKDIIRLAAILGLLLTACDQTSPEKLNALRAHAIPVRTVEPDDEDFTDLEPLRSVLKDSRVILLGEQSHPDGTTFLAKTRLIKFLHQEMDFDVLAFQSGFYDVQRAWTQREEAEGVRKAFEDVIYTGWAQSLQVQPLINYLGTVDSTDKPIDLVGFDMMFSGRHTWDYLSWELNDIAKLVGFQMNLNLIANQLRFGYMVRTVNDSMTVEKPSLKEQTAFRQLMAEFQGAVKNSTVLPPEQQAFWVQFCRNIVSYADFVLGHDNGNGTFESAQIRERQMGDNLVWLANQQYPSRKIVVWLAAPHSARNLWAVERLKSEKEDDYNQRREAKVAGDYIHGALGNEVYSLGFIPYAGKTGLPGEAGVLEATPPVTIEGMLVDAGFENAFIDFRNAEPALSWLQSPIPSGPLGHKLMTADWSQVFDGMMVLKEMKTSVEGPR